MEMKFSPDKLLQIKKLLFEVIYPIVLSDSTVLGWVDWTWLKNATIGEGVFKENLCYSGTCITI